MAQVKVYFDKIGNTDRPVFVHLEKVDPPFPGRIHFGIAGGGKIDWQDDAGADSKQRFQIFRQMIWNYSYMYLKPEDYKALSFPKYAAGTLGAVWGAGFFGLQ
jgi:hypothetical protein